MLQTELENGGTGDPSGQATVRLVLTTPPSTKKRWVALVSATKP